jgi:uncharacterized protein (DUF58 family)
MIEEPGRLEEATRQISFLPTPRLGYTLAVGAILTGLAAVWGMALWCAIVWLVILVYAVALEAKWLRGTKLITARRQVAPIFSLGTSHPVALELHNRSQENFYGLLADAPPAGFTPTSHRLSCTLPAAGEGVASYQVRPERRGDYAFGPLEVRLTGRLGLVARQLFFSLPTPIKVYPNIKEIRSYELQAQRHRLQQLGIHTSRLAGRGMEFESLRAYVPGDELRRMDWKATARRDTPITRQYDIERSQHVVMMLDLGRLMVSQLGTLMKADHAVNAAALVSHVASHGGDWVGLLAFAAHTSRYVAPRRGQFPLLLESLYSLQAARVESDYGSVFLEAAQRLRKRSLIILFTDLIDPDSSRRLVQAIGILARRHLVICAALSDYELYDLATQPLASPRDLYERAAAVSLLEDRRHALASLRQRGVFAFDATPSNFSIGVLNQYLEVKAQGLL